MILLFILAECKSEKKPLLEDESLGKNLLLISMLQNFCHYRIVKTEIISIPTVTVSGVYRICGDSAGDVRIKFADYSKTYRITAIPGTATYWPSCSGTVTVTYGAYMSGSAPLRTIVGSDERNVELKPSESESYLVTSSSPPGSLCRINGRIPLQTTEFRILFEEID